MVAAVLKPIRTKRIGMCRIFLHSRLYPRGPLHIQFTTVLALKNLIPGISTKQLMHFSFWTLAQQMDSLHYSIKYQAPLLSHHFLPSFSASCAITTPPSKHTETHCYRNRNVECQHRHRNRSLPNGRTGPRQIAQLQEVGL